MRFDEFFLQNKNRIWSKNQRFTELVLVFEASINAQINGPRRKETDESDPYQCNVEKPVTK